MGRGSGFAISRGMFLSERSYPILMTFPVHHNKTNPSEKHCIMSREQFSPQ